MTRPIPPCGTTAAFQRHRYRGERPCDPCREAYNAHQAAYLRRTGRARARQRAYVRLAHNHPDEHKALRELELETEPVRDLAAKRRAYQRAFHRLAARHRSEFARLLYEELTKEQNQ